MPRTGRPASARAKFDHKVLEANLTIGATMLDCEITMQMSAASIKRCIRRHYGRGMTFDQLAHACRTRAKLSARRNVFIAAQAKDKNGRLHNQAAAIHVAKVVGEWTERVTVREDDDQFAARQQSAAEQAEPIRTAAVVNAELTQKVMAMLAGVAKGR